MESLETYNKTLVARVSLILNGITYCKKSEQIQIADQSKKHTILRRYYECVDSEGDKIFRSLKFKVSNELLGLYFN